jgi:hypothetical protein
MNPLRLCVFVCVLICTPIHVNIYNYIGADPSLLHKQRDIHMNACMYVSVYGSVSLCMHLHWVVYATTWIR